jgi:hypothetical protein
MSKFKSPLPRKRWEYLKALRPSRGTFVHISCEAQMMPNPINSMGPMIPFVERPGHTLNLGRNKAKREARAARKAVA